MSEEINKLKAAIESQATHDEHENTIRGYQYLMFLKEINPELITPEMIEDHRRLMCNDPEYKKQFDEYEQLFYWTTDVDALNPDAPTAVDDGEEVINGLTVGEYRGKVIEYRKKYKRAGDNLIQTRTLLDKL
jgi:hypothetical protein